MRSTLLSFFFFIFYFSHGQLVYLNKDSLINRLAITANDTAKCELLIEISIQYNQDDNIEVHDSAKIYLDQLAELTENSDNLYARARAYYQYGKYYLRKENYLKSSEYLLRALNTFAAIQNTRGIADCYLQLGLIAYLNKNYFESIQQYSESVSNFIKVPDSLRAATVTYLIGLVYVETGNYELAFKNLIEALKVKMILGDARGANECKMGLGNLYVKTRDYDKAKYYFAECEAEFIRQNSSDGIVFTDLGYAAIYEANGELENARRRLLDAYERSMKLHNFSQVAKAAQALYRVFEKEGDFKNAYIYQSEYLKYTDSLFSQEKSRAIALLESKFNLEKKESQITLLNKQRLIDKILRYVLAAGILIFLLIAWILYRRFKFKKEANQKLAETNTVLQTALTNLKTRQAQLIQQEKMASLGQMAAGIAHEMRNPLNFVNNFSVLSEELIDEIKSAPSKEEQDKLLEEVKLNLSKIHHHGKRADNIVKGMMNHSRSTGGEKQFTDINAVCDTALTVAYNSMYNKVGGFNCRITKRFSKEIPQVIIVPQDFSRVLINLLNNAFYAVKEKEESGKAGSGWTPEVSIETKFENKTIIISIRDNGTGMSSATMKKIFQPFFTTKVTGEGTGLGLTICNDIVKSYGGTIEARSDEGKFSEFIIILPA